MKRAALLLLLAAAVQTQQPGQPVFRTALDVVTVDVSVRSLGTPVGGLTAKDFVLLDNGVPQTIQSVEMEDVPIDVSLLIDANEDVTMGLEHVHQDVRNVAALLRPSDRLRVTTINAGIADAVRARTGIGFPALEPVTTLRGISSAADGIGAALMRTRMDRPHLIIAVTNGVDASSTLSVEAVRDLARESQAVLHVATLDVELVLESNPPRYSTGRMRLDGARTQLSGVRPPQRLFWRPYDNPHDINVIKEAAESTGGGLHLPGLFRGGPARLFEKVFQDYRRSYLLRYTPTGVKREGWHEIAVTTPAYASYTVQHRRGYSIDAPAPASSAAPKPEGTTWAPASLASTIGAYNRGDYGPLESSLARMLSMDALIADFRKAGNPWPANPAREAAFAIELAEAALRTRRAPARESAVSLLKEHRVLVRHPIEPDRFERYWLWTAIAMLQGANATDITPGFVDYALTRFPDEPRFVLARAVAMDQTRAFETAEGRGGAGQESFVRDVTSRYDAAMPFPETALEARVRKAFFLHRIGRDADALDTLGAPPAADAGEVLRYYWHLFRGRMLEQLERQDEARAEYDTALRMAPRAQSPRVALMRLAVRSGDQPAAEALANEIQTARADAFDPWWVYWLGDYRQYGSIVGRLREMTR